MSVRWMKAPGVDEWFVRVPDGTVPVFLTPAEIRGVRHPAEVGNLDAWHSGTRKLHAALKEAEGK